MLSIVCIVICMWIIVRHRMQSKNRASVSGGGTAVGNQSPLSPSMLMQQPPQQQMFPGGPRPLGCNLDLHEMETLIGNRDRTSVGIYQLQPCLTIALPTIQPPNGIIARHTNGTNGSSVLSPPHDEHTEDEADSLLISSTPKKDYERILMPIDEPFPIVQKVKYMCLHLIIPYYYELCFIKILCFIYYFLFSNIFGLLFFRKLQQNMKVPQNCQIKFMKHQNHQQQLNYHHQP